jgi:hypothetical protein
MKEANTMPDQDKQPAQAPEPRPAPAAANDKGMHKVDQKTQEQAAKEREKSGGYD